MNETRIEALNIMLMAQGQVLETLLGITLGQLSAENSRNIKADLARNEEKFVRGYSGGPADAAALQAQAKLLQSEIDRILERSQAVEKAVRDALDRPPGHPPPKHR
jgi:hypothetical protein